MDLIRTLYDRVTQPNFALFTVALISLLSLISAFVAQYGFDLQPCILCIWQRWPHGLVAGMGLIYLLVGGWQRHGCLTALVLGYMIILHLIGGGIAVYHVGVEQRWWVGTPSCGVPAIDPNDIEAIRQLINSKAVRCDEPQWYLFGITMAGYNALLSFGLAIYAGLALLKGIRYTRSIED